MSEKVLVLCTGNSCRSQMAHGFLKQYKNIEVYSAGIEAHGLNPRAVQVMKEAGIDISGHTSNLVDEYAHIPFDLVLTVCDNALESCPILPGKTGKLHASFPDPAKVTGSEEVVMNEFRKVRDQIRDYCNSLAKEKGWT